jgi:hypothetical protein
MSLLHDACNLEVFAILFKKEKENARKRNKVD